MTRTRFVSTIATFAIAAAMSAATPAHADPEPVLSYTFNTPGVGKLASIHPEPVRTIDIGKLGSIHPEPVRNLDKVKLETVSPVAIIDPYPTASDHIRNLNKMTAFKGLKGDVVGFKGLKGDVGFKGLKGNVVGFKGLKGNVVGFKGLKGATAFKGMTGSATVR